MAKSNKTITKDLKVTDEELQKIQNLVKTINQLQMSIGGLEIQKSIAVQRLHSFQSDIDTFQVEMKTKYGDVSVNLQSGILQETPRQNEVNKKN
jgi:FtsZ-binding cell division protein ZapB|tara:strand:- start:2820 stop:3101 length:282 start_codon:yes stop_codon:yes gene_type:complete